MNILVVEDEPMILKGISFLLKEYEYPKNETPSIYAAQDGEEADRFLYEHTFDIIFTDIKMPGMDGVELINKWARQKPITQWVVISGFNDFEFTREAIQNGVKDYLLKPVTKKKMTEAMNRLLENRQKLVDSFISITQSQEILDQLENAIWMLDEEAAEQNFIEWTKNLPLDSLSLLNFQVYLKEVLELLNSRLIAKGIRDLDGQVTSVSGDTKRECKESFVNSCFELINIIRIKRKGNIIDPIEAAKEYIQSNLGDRLTLKDAADRLGLNPTYFSQLFKKETGESFVNYRRKVRMERAKQLLEQNEMRIIDVSNEVGYGDLPHFTKSFKQYTGDTPSEYKYRLGITT